jgi:hypothetical protein
MIYKHFQVYKHLVYLSIFFFFFGKLPKHFQVIVIFAFKKYKAVKVEVK